ncbi:MAG TPA: CaiB/BaiF CoA-transferase family protein [Rhizomicrobium sp.]|nr:CaiB/BaiF CoA-transferase family protein [Rhizomicrobium sp.]
MNAAPAIKPLAGMKVLELSRILAGPWACQILADLGADVIKVEQPGKGDETRLWGPPFIGADAAYFHSANRGKRSITLDLATPRGQLVARALAARSDVLVENFRAGVLEKFGLDHESLKAATPRLVYCSITGFGQDGPYAHRPGFDAIVQAMGGLMSITGEKGAPQKVGVAIADILTGVYAVAAIEAALLERERTGAGRHIDMALMDVQVSMLANQAMNYLASGVVPAAMGSNHPNIVPYQLFRVKDGAVMVAVGTDAQFRALCAVLEAKDLSADPRFADNAGRVAAREALIPALCARLATWDRAALLAALENAGVPAGPVNDIAQVFADPQVVHRAMRTDTGVRTPIMIDGAAAASTRPAPGLGEHTEEILRELGL